MSLMIEIFDDMCDSYVKVESVLDRFLDSCVSFTRDSDEGLNVYMDSDGEVMMKQCFKTGDFLFNYYRLWHVYESVYYLHYDDICSLLIKLIKAKFGVCGHSVGFFVSSNG